MKYLNQNNDEINVLETGTARGFLRFACQRQS